MSETTKATETAPTEAPKYRCPFCGGTGRGPSVDGECNACVHGLITAEGEARYRQHVKDLAKVRAKRARRGRW